VLAGPDGHAEVISSDAPFIDMLNFIEVGLASPDGQTVLGKVSWPFVSVSRKQFFRTYLVVFNIATEWYCCLRQAEWSLELDSLSPNAPADQHADVKPDEPPSVDPATARGEEVQSDAFPFGSETKTLTMPGP
jgi:hypothetical protein